MTVPTDPCSSQHLVLSVLWILSILIGAPWYLIILTYNSLMTYELSIFYPYLNWVVSLISFQIRSDQSLSRVWLFATPWIAAHQASLAIDNSRSSLRFISIESVMPSSHLILSSPSPPNPNPSQHQSLFQWVNSSHEVAKVLEFQL